MGNIQSIQDILEECKKDEKKLFSKDGFKGVSVDIKNNDITLNREYSIPIDRLSTKSEILHWVIHLLAKNWITTDHLYLLATTAADINEINIWDDELE